MKIWKLFVQIGLVLIVAAGISGCIGIGRTSVSLQSDQGDYIGGGQTYNYSLKNSIIGVTANGNHLVVSVTGDQQWTGDFVLPNSVSQLQVGTFTNLQRYPFNDQIKGGLQWSDQGRGCNTLQGSLTINSVTYSSGVLTAIELSFEQHCEGATPALKGQIIWLSNDQTKPPGPVTPPPSTLWQPATGATPTSGNYVYLQSDSGDYIGGGQTYTYTPANATLTITANGGLLTVGVNGNEQWTGDFQAMNTLTTLQPGYYAGVQRYPFNNPTKGGLSWYGQGRGCNTSLGWFAIDNVTYSSGTLTAIDLRFEQHCEGMTPALHGKIHWGS